MGRILLSICAAVVAAGLGGSAQAPSNSTASDARQDMPVAASLSRIANAIEAQNAIDDSDREERDLDAQEDMAKWAKLMFWAATVQAFLSLLGIVLIYTTFRETRRAANSADDIVNVTKDSVERQLRPWMLISELDHDQMADGSFTVKVVWKNFGSSPAVDVEGLTISSSYVPVGEVPLPQVADADAMGILVGVVAPGTNALSLIESLSPDQFLNQHLSIQSRCRYSDPVSMKRYESLISLTCQVVHGPRGNIAMRWARSAPDQIN